MICWYCHWGWPQQVADIYNRHFSAIGESAMNYGPAHIVWEDENFGDDSIRWCLERIDEYRRDLTDAEVAAVKQSLEELLSIPEEIRCCEPEDYDGEHPENYPPPFGMVMVERDYRA